MTHFPLLDTLIQPGARVRVMLGEHQGATGVVVSVDGATVLVRSDRASATKVVRRCVRDVEGIRAMSKQIQQMTMEKLAEWIVQTYLMFGCQASTAYKVAGAFVAGIGKTEFPVSRDKSKSDLDLLLLLRIAALAFKMVSRWAVGAHPSGKGNAVGNPRAVPRLA